jgi:hypothetical protein
MIARMVSEAVVSEMRKFNGSPLVRSTGTNSRDDEIALSSNRHLPANFILSEPTVACTNYELYNLTQRQRERTDSFKYYQAMQSKVRERYGEHRYAIHKSRNHMIIKDGNTLIFKCSIKDHSMRCAYLELLSLDFDVSQFITGEARKPPAYFQTTVSPEHID